MSLEIGREPRRTFILPVYNAAPFLAGTLEKVVGWLEARSEPWELIIVLANQEALREDTAPAMESAVRVPGRREAASTDRATAHAPARRDLLVPAQ